MTSSGPPPDVWSPDEGDTGDSGLASGKSLTPAARGVHGRDQELARIGALLADARHGRSGTLWEGRYRSTLIQSERYLLACMAYIDLNPVRAGLVADPADYPWSSHRHYLGSRNDKLVTPHPLVWEMGNTPFAREAAYGELVRAGISQEQQQALTSSALRGCRGPA